MTRSAIPKPLLFSQGQELVGNLFCTFIFNVQSRYCDTVPFIPFSPTFFTLNYNLCGTFEESYPLWTRLNSPILTEKKKRTLLRNNLFNQLLINS